MTGADALVQALSGEARASAETELYRLLALRCDRYTNGDSTSMPLETVREIMEGIVYTLELGLAGRPPTGDLMEAFHAGQEINERLYAQAERLLKEVQEACVRVENIALHDTLYGALPQFLKGYNPQFFAHDPACMIDYPLCVPVEDERGARFICEYLERLKLENGFLRRFDVSFLNKLYRTYVPDPVGQLINLFEPVWMCTLAAQAEPYFERAARAVRPYVDIAQSGKQGAAWYDV